MSKCKIQHTSIENFIPSRALARAAAESFNQDMDWVKYGAEDNQIQYCSKLGREKLPTAARLCLNYIATNFDPNSYFRKNTNYVFPDLGHYGGGMMLTPNSNGEGGFLGMHIDAEVHGLHKDWKREYSVIIGLSEKYDSSFDLLIHNGKDKHARVPYKFNSLWAFKTSENSWHGVDKITEGLDRKSLGIMYWSKSEEGIQTKAKFNNDLEFD